jgi:hypothetical protein
MVVYLRLESLWSRDYSLLVGGMEMDLHALRIYVPGRRGRECMLEHSRREGHQRPEAAKSSSWLD